MNKKEIKKAIHDNGFFLSIPIDTNAPSFAQKYKNEIDSIPENAFPWGGIASQEVINANGYGIRLNAWRPAIATYLAQNPIIFFGHEDNQALGHTLSAKVTKESLEVMGYVRRQADQQYAAGNIEAGIYRMLSTGHMTEDFEFQNEKTNEVMSKQEFREVVSRQGYGEWLNDWYLWVTKLRFLEWSIVGIGAVNTAFKSNSGEEIWLNHFNLSKDEIMTRVLTNGVDVTPENEGETPEVVDAPTVEAGETPDAAPDATTTEQTPPADVEDTTEGVPPAETVEDEAADAQAENAEAVPAPESNTVAITVAQNAMPDDTRKIALLTGQKVLEVEARLNKIEARLNSVSVKRAIRPTFSSNEAPQGRTLADLINK